MRENLAWRVIEFLLKYFRKRRNVSWLTTQFSYFQNYSASEEVMIEDNYVVCEDIQ